MTLLYNLESSLTPPPSMEDFENNYVRPLVLESQKIESIKYAIVKNCLDDTLKNHQIEGLPADFLNLLQRYHSSEGMCMVNQINWVDENDHQIPLVDEDFSKSALQKVKEKFNVSGIVSYSPIVFDLDGKKALIFFGATREGLDAHWSIYFLEKENGTWKIFTSRLLEFS